MRLDEVVEQLKGDTKNNVFIEIEGHTDNVGSKEGNYELGLERAEAVKRYLYMQHQIPLHKISVISYGEEKPVAPNNTRGRPRAESPRRRPRSVVKGRRVSKPRRARYSRVLLRSRLFFLAQLPKSTRARASSFPSFLNR